MRRTRLCGLYRDFDRRATGVLHRVLHGLLRDLVQGGGDPGIEVQRRVDVNPQRPAEAPADARSQAVERGAQPARSTAEGFSS